MKNIQVYSLCYLNEKKVSECYESSYYGKMNNDLLVFVELSFLRVLFLMEIFLCNIWPLEALAFLFLKVKKLKERFLSKQIEEDVGKTWLRHYLVYFRKRTRATKSWFNGTISVRLTQPSHQVLNLAPKFCQLLHLRKTSSLSNSNIFVFKKLNWQKEELISI